jgi:predicted small lipoprotein YifL
MLDWKRSRSYLAVAVVAASLGACGSNGPGKCPDGTTGVPPNCMSIQVALPCTQTTVESGAGPAKARTLYHFDFSVPDSGRLDITMDWTNPASPVGIYLVPANTCTLAEFNARTCNFLVRSEPSSVKPRKISVANFNAGNYRWLLGTFGDTDESISYQFVLSKGSCAALTGAQPSVSAQGPEAFPALTRAESH